MKGPLKANRIYILNRSNLHFLCMSPFPLLLQGVSKFYAALRNHVGTTWSLVKHLQVFELNKFNLFNNFFSNGEMEVDTGGWKRGLQSSVLPGPKAKPTYLTQHHFSPLGTSEKHGWSVSLSRFSSAVLVLSWHTAMFLWQAHCLYFDFIHWRVSCGCNFKHNI